MVVKVKVVFEKTRHVKKTRNLKNIFYVDKEMHDIMKEFYLIQGNLIISISFLIQHNCIISRLSSV